MHIHTRSAFLAALLAAPFSAAASPVINEIFFRSATVPENTAHEWLELYNPDPVSVDVSGWRLSKGVDFTIPPATTIPVGGHLVIAANVATFQAEHPGFAGSLVGGWTGQLSNNGEQVRLEDTSGTPVHEVNYASEGDWAVRIRGPLSFSHRGWAWECPADGGGRSLELIGLSVGTGTALDHGLAWKSSTASGGTPGAVNSVAAANPEQAMAVNVRHKPDVPHSTDTIQIYAELPPGGTTNRACYWRVDGAVSFNVAIFSPTSSTSGQGFWKGVATIPAQPNGTVIEYYVDPDNANAASVNDSWPRMARTSNPGVQPETYGHACNALIQVDDSFNPALDFTVAGNQPLLRLVMKDAERAELAQIGSTSGQEDSEAEMNATFVSHDGEGTTVRYVCGVRNRGQASALGPPNNFHVAFVNGDDWNGRRSLTLNCQYGYGQVLGNVLFALAGVAPQDAVAVQVRVNGADLAESGSRMFGRYALLEGRGSDWAKKHYPLDSDGNLYRLDDHASGAVGTPPGNLGSGEFQYEGADPAAYSDTFIKETNKDANDYSDLVNFTRVVSAPATGGSAEQPAISDAAYPAAVAAVLDVDQFYRFIATDALIGNQEGGLQSGRADDTSIYRGMIDPRFRFVPHDMDDVFDIGSGVGDPVTRSIFSYDEYVQQGNTGVVGLRRLFNHPALLPKYYAALLGGLDTWFTHATLDPIIDRIMQGWVPAGSGAASPARNIAAIKAFIDARRSNVLAQIQQNFSLTTTGTTADSPEGYKVSTTGAATFAGTFAVARTYSITVNGMAAQAFYRTVGADAAGTWKLVLPAGGGGLLTPGLNHVVVRFWSGLNGTGSVLQEFLSKIVWNGVAPDSLTLTVPQTYVPGVPVLVRADLKTGNGQLNREAWNTTVNLTATNGVALSPATITLANGMGSALVTLGTSSGGGTVNFLTYGTGGTGSTSSNSGTPGSTWKYRGDFTSATLAAFISSSGTTWKNEGFDDSAWPSIVTQTGYGDGDENRAFARVDYGTGSGTQSSPSYLFRNTFTIADLSQLASVTGQVKYDDAAAVYVNGTEVLRTATLPAGAALTSYANSSPAQENATTAITVPLGLLHNGVNTIAVEIHQASATSTDVTFDLRLQGNLFSVNADPGNFTLTATAGPSVATRAMTSLGTNPPGTTASGTLPAGTTNWSGVVRVTGDLTVPAGATLEIAPGTHVLMAGTSGAGDTGGADLICTGGGIINALGTAAQPISITASEASTRWGEVNVGGSTTLWQYCLVSRAAHSPGGGHTGTGPAFRLGNGAVWTFEDGVISDLSGKILTNSGSTTLVMRRSQFARCVMGPEIDGSALTVEDSNFSDMLPIYRESGGPDDEDNLYIHDSGGRPVNLRRSVFYNCGDDAVDCLSGSLSIEDCIIRNAFDKGLSLLNNNVTVRRTRIIDCDICVSTKCQVGGTESTPFLNSFENCTIVAENHPTNTSDGTFHSVGVHTRNKYGTTTMNITVDLHNCIVSAEEPVANDYGGGTFPLNVQNYTCFFDQGGSNPTNPLPSSGTGNLTANPQFVNAGAKNFNLAAASPCLDAGDPAPAYNDPDGSRNDMGALPAGSGPPTQGTLVNANITAPGETRWTLAGSPYHVTASISVAPGSTLRIDPGVNVQCDQNVRITVNGRILAQGTAAQRIVFSHVPGTSLATDVDPIKLGTQTGAPKWGGLRIVDSMAQENIVSFADFINAQGTSPGNSENYGSLGFIRSWGWADHCTFAGTHLRMLYGRNSKLTFTYNTMPDMFLFDPALNRIEEPTTDFIPAADNSMEPMKVEYPTTDAEVSGNANYPNGMPLNGHWRCYFNQFHGNRGHQDVFDCDSGRWAPRDPVTNHQTNGQFVIDCRYNHFHGLAGDEHMDLGGDAYIASNVFKNARKDYWTNDTGYSNAISSGDKGSGTTIMVARNICYDLDHVINCKANTATIFEHNTVANLHADFQFQGQSVTQNVVCAPVNFFIPGDGVNPSVGDGAFMGFNIVSNVPHLFSGPDTNAQGHGITTKIEFFHNLLDAIADPEIGPNHPGGFFSGAYGPNQSGAPGFVNPAAEDYGLRTDSLARATAPGGLNYGAGIAEWAYLLGGPSGTVAETDAAFTVGGPGVVAYKWRIDGGTWSAPVQIGFGGQLNRSGANPRQATLTLTGLGAGPHTLEVLGQDMAGNWQGNDPARTYDGAAQAAPTTRTWTVDTALPLVFLSEVHGDTAPGTPALPVQWVELVNRSTTTVDLTGWSLSDDPLTPGEQALSGPIAPGAAVIASLAAFQIDNDGDAIYLFDAANAQRDSVVFGPLPDGHSLGRAGAPAAWQLCDPTFGTLPNTPARLSDSSQVVINEWLAASDVRYRDDWVELANPAPYPASLTGMILTDARFGTGVAFPPLSFIGGNGYVKLIADGKSEDGPGHTSFKIDGITEELLLFAASGAQQDSVRVFPQVQDVSQGRVATGGVGGLDFFPLATGGAANVTGGPGYANALALLDGLRITEIMYNPPGGSSYEFIELTNIGSETLDLSGVVFFDGIDFTFPPGTLLPGGGEIVLVKNLAAFEERYGAGLNVGGVYTGSLDNSGELLGLRLPYPWDAGILWFRYEATWHDTNASGYSLTLLNSATPSADFDEPETWTASTQIFGTPDSWVNSHPDGLAAWLAAHALTVGDLPLDSDFDGLANTLEYALNTDPHSGRSPQGADRLPAAGTSGDGFATITFDLPASALAGGHGCPGVSYEIRTGTDLAVWSTVAKKSPATAAWTDSVGGALPAGAVTVTPIPGGLVRITVKDSVPVASSQRRFLRLQVTISP